MRSIRTLDTEKTSELFGEGWKAAHPFVKTQTGIIHAIKVHGQTPWMAWKHQCDCEVGE